MINIGKTFEQWNKTIFPPKQNISVFYRIVRVTDFCPTRHQVTNLSNGKGWYFLCFEL